MLEIPRDVLNSFYFRGFRACLFCYPICFFVNVFLFYFLWAIESPRKLFNEMSESDILWKKKQGSLLELQSF